MHCISHTKHSLWAKRHETILYCILAQSLPLFQFLGLSASSSSCASLPCSRSFLRLTAFCLLPLPITVRLLRWEVFVHCFHLPCHLLPLASASSKPPGPSSAPITHCSQSSTVAVFFSFAESQAFRATEASKSRLCIYGHDNLVFLH